jgi:hypothetical protein
VDRGIPYYTLDPATGEMVAVYDDGTVTPVPGSGGGTDASNSTPGTPWSGAQQAFTQPITGTTSVSGSDSATGRRAELDSIPSYAGLSTEPIPPPGTYGVGAESRSGGGGYGGGMDVRARLASARARIQGALGGGYGGGGYSGGGSYDSGGGIPRPERPDRLRGPYARGLDPAQAGGLTLHPTAMLPRVFRGLTPADPTYNRLAALPVGQWAQILGNGSPQSLANMTGRLYQRAGTSGALPSTDKLLRNLMRGGGVEDMFQGVKAGPGDYESYLQPGYVSGQEPMPMGEAAYTYGGLLDAALSQEPLLTAQKYGVASGGWGSYLVDKWASKAMKKAPGAGKPIYKSVGRKLFR